MTAFYKQQAKSEDEGQEKDKMLETCYNPPFLSICMLVCNIMRSISLVRSNLYKNKLLMTVKRCFCIDSLIKHTLNQAQSFK